MDSAAPSGKPEKAVVGICARCGKVYYDRTYYKDHLARTRLCSPDDKVAKKRERPVPPPYVMEWEAEVPKPILSPAPVKAHSRGKETVHVSVDAATMFQNCVVPADADCVLDPFSNSPHRHDDVVRFAECFGKPPLFALDADPIMKPPTYGNAWIIARPPIGLRRTFEDRSAFELYEGTDLYKCFLASFLQQPTLRGGFLILPLSFFVVGEDVQRSLFLGRYLVTSVHLWQNAAGGEKPLAAIAFERSPTTLTTQTIRFTQFPERKQQVFTLHAADAWEFKVDIMPRSDVWFSRYIEGETLADGAQVLSLLLHTLDSQGSQGRIHIEYKRGYVYPGKKDSRAMSTLVAHGRRFSEAEQLDLATAFNLFLEAERERLWSLFLMAFDERNGHVRQRISFRLAFRILAHLTPARLLLKHA